MLRSEKEWAKKNGLKKTEHTILEKGKEHIVYQAADGNYFFRSHNVWMGTFEEYFFK